MGKPIIILIFAVASILTAIDGVNAASPGDDCYPLGASGPCFVAVVNNRGYTELHEKACRCLWDQTHTKYSWKLVGR